ncbi:hypothetical protein [Pseudomonas sp. CGJS7]|uniref:hypothetical protein n=1 Tax=Pseudomonas sp. CGJS7 TaxID=3109348 RepID=UPI00300B26DD
MTTTIDPDLERAIEHFKNQPGVNADQVEQLRSAIQGDPRLLLDLNQAAVAGQIRGFAPQPAAGARPNLIGTYDLATGVITLPASSLQASGTTASADLNAVLQVQDMSVRFANGRYPNPENSPDSLGDTLPVTQEMVDNLQATFNGSPLLAEQIKRAATTPDPEDTFAPPRNHVENFGFISDTRIAGNYDGDGKTINILASKLQADRYDPIGMTFLLGHEIEHGLNHPVTRQAGPTLRAEAGAVAAGTSVVHDYTAAIGKYVQSGRINEAEAEIAGWNAVLSNLQQRNPSANLTEMLGTGNPNMHDFVERDPVTNAVRALPAPAGEKPLSFNADGSLTPTADNIAAIGRRYFDRPAATPGIAGESFYPNYYGAHAVEAAIEAERQHVATHPGVDHQMTIDMASLQLSESALEREGIDIDTNPRTPQPYYDSSHGSAVLRHFDHTQDGSVSPAHDHRYVPAVPSSHTPHQTDAAAPQALSPNDLAMHARIRADLTAPVSDEVLTRAVRAANQQGMERPEQIGSAALINDRLWVASTVPGFVASVDVNARTIAPQAGTQTPVQNDQREQAAQAQEPARTGPRP